MASPCTIEHLCRSNEDPGPNELLSEIHCCQHSSKLCDITEQWHLHRCPTLQPGPPLFDEDIHQPRAQFLGYPSVGPTYTDKFSAEPIDYSSNQAFPSPTQHLPGTECRGLNAVFHDMFPRFLHRFYEILGQLPADIPPSLLDIVSPLWFFSMCRSLVPAIIGAQLLTFEGSFAMLWLQYAFDTCSDWCASPCEGVTTPSCLNLCVHGIRDRKGKEAALVVFGYLLRNGNRPMKWHPRGSADSGFEELQDLNNNPFRQPQPQGRSILRSTLLAGYRQTNVCITQAVIALRKRWKGST
jgi:hypothetical protein